MLASELVWLLEASEDRVSFKENRCRDLGGQKRMSNVSIIFHGGWKLRRLL